MSNLNHYKSMKKGFFASIREAFCLMKENRNPRVKKHFRSGINHFQNRDFEKSIEEFRRVIDIKEDHFSAHAYLARLYSITGNKKEALREYAYAQTINISRYKTYNLMDEHMRLIYHGRKKNLLNELADNLERCARNLTDAAKKMQGAAKKQKKSIEKLSEINKKFKIRDLDVGKVEIEIGEYGDFRDLDEYVKFLTLPPITEEEKNKTDWDDVIHKILE